MPPYARKRTHADIKQMSLSAMACLAYPLNEDMEVSDLLGVMDQWHTPEYFARRCGLDVDELLAVAIIQECPLALQTWLHAGAPVNADTLLALMSLTTKPGHDHVVYDHWSLLRPAFTTPTLAPWHGCLFAHATLVRAPGVAASWITSGLITPQTPLPATRNDAMQWLWSWDPHLRNASEATLPLQLCLASGQFALAEQWLAMDPGNMAMCTRPDGRGLTPLDEVSNYLALHRNSLAGKEDIEHAQRWFDQLEALRQGEVLDRATTASTVDPDLQSAPPRRL